MHFLLVCLTVYQMQRAYTFLLGVSQPQAKDCCNPLQICRMLLVRDLQQQKFQEELYSRHKSLLVHYCLGRIASQLGDFRQASY